MFPGVLFSLEVFDSLNFSFLKNVGTLSSRSSIEVAKKKKKELNRENLAKTELERKERKIKQRKENFLDERKN